MNKTGIILITIFVIIIVIAIIFVTIYFKNKSLLKIKGGQFTALYANSEYPHFDSAIFTIFHYYISKYGIFDAFGNFNGFKINNFGNIGFVNILQPQFLSDSLYLNIIIPINGYMLSKCEYPSKYLRNYIIDKNINILQDGFFNSGGNKPPYLKIFKEDNTIGHYFNFGKKWYNIDFNHADLDLDVYIKSFFSKIDNYMTKKM